MTDTDYIDELLEDAANLRKELATGKEEVDYWVKKWSDQNEQLNAVVGELDKLSGN